MKPIKFTLSGNTPSKKTGQSVLTGFKSIFKNKKVLAVLMSCGVPQSVISKLFYRVTFPKIMPGKKYKPWLNANKLEGVPPVSEDDCPVEIHMKFYRGSRHKFDYPNVEQSVFDLLKDRCIIPDDNADICIPVHYRYEYCKENPRCEVEIVGGR